MANDGYMGKILRVDLTNKKVSTIDTGKYKKYGGGHGMGTAIFFDECEDPTVEGIDPKNVLTIMTSPLSGTIAPAASGRTEVQAIGTQGYPINWFTRSNFGGRFSGMLKYAGWDGIVIKGKAKEPCWIDIRNDKVTIQSATGVWGLDTYETQEEIWRRVRNSSGRQYGEGWYSIEKGRDSGNTIFDPCVLAIGPLGETLSPLASLIHEGGNGAGQGGFGAVFGSKNLKAVSVIGTGEVVPADMKELVDTRLWAQQYSARDATVETFTGLSPVYHMGVIEQTFGERPGGAVELGAPTDQPSVPYGCMACHRCCRRRWQSGKSNGSSCVDFAFYSGADSAAHGKATQTVLDASDMMQRYGANAFTLLQMLPWIQTLWKKGILGPGKEIDTDLPMELWGSDAFAAAFFEKVAKREDVGKYLHMGIAQGAEALGRFDKDTTSGDLPVDAWGYSQHYDVRAEVEWGYSTLLGDRDCNEHDFNPHVYWVPTFSHLLGIDTPYTAETLNKTIGEVCARGGEKYKDEKLLDYSDEGIYSDSAVHLVAWYRHYTRYYKQSMLFCDWSYADLWNTYTPDNKGLTGVIEPRIVKAVTAKNESFEEGMETGRKIWNFDRAIWCLQGRKADMEHFTNYAYDVPQPGGATPYLLPAYIDGKWEFHDCTGRKLDRDKLDAWKQKYYAFEGWDTNGVPTRKTLEELDLKPVADALEKAGKLS
ncbi:MAG: aldehyde:ferredoxin oxidoreductase [Coriobacteriia bacterium]|nr:aldehyde:ferredoxin oxidoreductase [Coriobacteriia bacterium]